LLGSPTYHPIQPFPLVSNPLAIASSVLKPFEVIPKIPQKETTSPNERAVKNANKSISTTRLVYFKAGFYYH